MTTLNITTKNKTEGHPKFREVITPMPACLATETLDDLIGLLGADMIKSYAERQLTIAFRSWVRGPLSSEDDQGDFVNDDEYFASPDFQSACADWIPTQRVVKSDAEKAQELINKLAANGMSADQIQDILNSAISAQG